MKRIVLYAVCVMIVACQNGNKQNADIADVQNHVVVEAPKELSAEDIYEMSIDKIAMIMSYQGGIPASQGSGFFINENTLITNYHCVEGADAIQIKLAGIEEVFKGARVIKYSETYDLAIIRTTQEFPYLLIDSLGAEKVGAKIYAIGNPRGLEGTISDGILSGKRIYEDVEYLQITAPINPGNSGGPVLNNEGKVIGVATFTFKNSQNLNFAMPIKYIEECIDYDRTKVIAKTKKKKTEKDAISMTFFEKNGSEFDEFITLRNNTNDDICAVTGVIIYKTMDGDVLDYRTFNRNVLIPVGLAKRFGARSFDQNQSWRYYKSDGGKFYKSFKVEFRLLSYEIYE